MKQEIETAVMEEPEVVLGEVVESEAQRTELIEVIQLPIIKQHLQDIKADIEDKVSKVLALECNESTVKAIKVLRADLNKDLAELEVRRKEVKSAVMSPYEQFEAIYKECVSSVFKEADAELKRRVGEVEDGMKAEKREEVTAYFEEYRKSKHIDFVDFEDTGINVTMSASLKSLKESAKAFLDRVADDLALIGTQENEEEIFVEYKRSLNVSQAITTVVERHKAIEQERQRQAEAEQAKIAEQQAVEKVEAVAAGSAPLSAPKPAEGIYKMTFTVTATRPKLRELKKFLEDGGYQFG